MSLFRRRILGGPGGLEVFGGDVLSLKTLRFGAAEPFDGEV